MREKWGWNACWQEFKVYNVLDFSRFFVTHVVCVWIVDSSQIPSWDDYSTLLLIKDTHWAQNTGGSSLFSWKCWLLFLLVFVLVYKSNGWIPNKHLWAKARNGQQWVCRIGLVTCAKSFPAAQRNDLTQIHVRFLPIIECEIWALHYIAFVFIDKNVAFLLSQFKSFEIRHLIMYAKVKLHGWSDLSFWSAWQVSSLIRRCLHLSYRHQTKGNFLDSRTKEWISWPHLYRFDYLPARLSNMRLGTVKQKKRLLSRNDAVYSA